jgi:hypothetical protein
MSPRPNEAICSRARVPRRLSVQPADECRERPDHAGVPLGLDLDEDAARTRRRHRDRAASGRPRQAGADRVAVGEGFRSRQYGGDRGVQYFRLSD